jgi:hypothetical protein
MVRHGGSASSGALDQEEAAWLTVGPRLLLVLWDALDALIAGRSSGEPVRPVIRELCDAAHAEGQPLGAVMAIIVRSAWSLHMVRRAEWHGPDAEPLAALLEACRAEYGTAGAPGGGAAQAAPAGGPAGERGLPAAEV